MIFTTKNSKQYGTFDLTYHSEEDAERLSRVTKLEWVQYIKNLEESYSFFSLILLRHFRKNSLFYTAYKILRLVYIKIYHIFLLFCYNYSLSGESGDS